MVRKACFIPGLRPEAQTGTLAGVRVAKVCKTGAKGTPPAPTGGGLGWAV
jgi:hypothetical protein